MGNRTVEELRNDAVRVPKEDATDDFSTFLLIQVLRATIRCVEEPPGISPEVPGMRHFEGVLLEEVAKIVGQNSRGMPMLSA